MMKDNSQPLIVVKDVKKYYKGEVIKALDGINLTINEGEVVVIIGPSGSGKSTMLRCLNLLEIPTDGEIIFEGENLLGKKTNIDKHRQKMGMVFQHFNLFPHMTVMKNMTIAPTKLKIKNKEEAEAKANYSADYDLIFLDIHMKYQVDRNKELQLQELCVWILK